MGPLLVLLLLPVLLSYTRNIGRVAVFGVCMLPWLVWHHALNYAVGGMFKPANATAEYFDWPGSPFNAQNITGVWNQSLGHFLLYAPALMFGKRGFVGHDLALFLLIVAPGLYLGWMAHCRERPSRGSVPDLARHDNQAGQSHWREALFCVGWFVGSWLLYATLSTNSSGPCCSIRWFVPLLAPAYFLLALFLRDNPSYYKDFLVLSGWGLLLAALMWQSGPWMQHMVPGFWLFQAAALLSWLACRRWDWVRQRSSIGGAPQPAVSSRAA
jgi:hypothetical protein